MRLLLVTIITFLSISVFAQKSATDLLGKWYTEDDKSIVQIFIQGNKYYGKIVWLKEPNGDNGKPKKDAENPDEAKQSRAVLGMVFMTGFTFDGEDEWEDGELYDPESGYTYNGTIEFEDENYLSVRGYVGISLIGRTTYWRRTK